MKTTKIQLALLIVISLFISSCGQKGWTEQEKKDFLKGCVKANKARLSEKTAQKVCECMLNKMVTKYPTMKESQKMSKAELKDMAVDCWNGIKDDIDSFVLHKTKGGKVGFLLNCWQDRTPENFDMRCTNGQVNMNVYVHNTKDLKTGTTKKDVLNIYVKNLMGKRKNEKKEFETEIKSNEKTIYQAVYSADNDTNKNMYSFNVVDLGEDTDTFVFVLFITTPSYGEKHLQDFNNILKTTRVLR